MGIREHSYSETNMDILAVCINCSKAMKIANGQPGGYLDGPPSHEADACLLTYTKCDECETLHDTVSVVYQTSGRYMGRVWSMTMSQKMVDCLAGPRIAGWLGYNKVMTSNPEFLHADIVRSMCIEGSKRTPVSVGMVKHRVGFARLMGSLEDWLA